MPGMPLAGRPTGRPTGPDFHDPAPKRGGVVLLHGFVSPAIMMAPLGRSLSAAGYALCTPSYTYATWRQDLTDIVARLHAMVARFAAEQGERPVHFVGHSMGGLIARALIARERPGNLGRVVMLGTPNGGSEIADQFSQNRLLSAIVLGGAASTLVTHRDADHDAVLGRLDYPTGIIAGNRAFLEGPLEHMLPRPNDGKVSVAATHVEGEADHIVLPLSHAALLRGPAARDQVLHFLENGRFSR